MLESFNKVARETPALMSSFEFCEIFKKQSCRHLGEGGGMGAQAPHHFLEQKCFST